MLLRGAREKVLRHAPSGRGLRPFPKGMPLVPQDVHAHPAQPAVLHATAQGAVDLRQAAGVEGPAGEGAGTGMPTLPQDVPAKTDGARLLQRCLPAEICLRAKKAGAGGGTRGEPGSGHARVPVLPRALPHQQVFPGHLRKAGMQGGSQEAPAGPKPAPRRLQFGL